MYNIHVLAFPTSVCPSCLRNLVNPDSKHNFSEKRKSQIKEQLERALDIRKTRSEQTDPSLINSPSCIIKKKDAPSNINKLISPHRRKRTVIKTKSSASINLDDAFAMSSAMRSTGRSLARGLESLGLRGLSVPSGANYRKHKSKLNQIFASNFESVDCNLSPDDGAAIMCKHVAGFLEKSTAIKGKQKKDVALIKFNVDGGRGSLKLCAQVIYADDPVLRKNATETERAAYAKENGGVFDTSVRRVFILGLISGAKETFESTKFLCDSLIDLDNLKSYFVNAEIVVPVDIKQANKMAGIGEHGSLRPLSGVLTLEKTFQTRSCSYSTRNHC
ncbi:uncharacterized protein LOC121377334 [Gigantopelta aegis]|uniref:uncharacterized protein LOC121377334 n=1 Tax=Gigantopelta aegis TaxID=1735272 RepID=UPI001B888950|nr:uncharacterized protein LOC121377334 [Gigantopelta aegis]